MSSAESSRPKSVAPNPSPSGNPPRPKPSVNPTPARKFRGVWSLWPTVFGVLLHFVLRTVLDTWLNAPSDAKFWGAATILLAPLVFAGYALSPGYPPAPQLTRSRFQTTVVS